jgi:uncharacterized protein YaeQ
MALTATVYTLHIDLADIDRGVYEALDLRVARHPSETMAYMMVRVLAYCLEYTDGIAFTDGVSSGDEPAVIARDLTGQVTHWVEVGIPDASRLHRAAKAARHVAVYTHRDVRQLLGQLAGERIHRASELRIRALDRTAVEAAGERLDRRTSFGLTVAGGELTLAFDAQTLVVPVTEHALGRPVAPERS